MANFRVKLSERAERDLKDIWLYIAEQSMQSADDFLGRLNVRIASLVEFPDCGSDRSDIAKGARILIEANYLILYRKTKREIEIIRVVHGAMDLAKLNLT